VELEDVVAVWVLMTEIVEVAVVPGEPPTSPGQK
jgi:hypothetical protein